MFASKMPGRVQRCVRLNNLQFLCNRNVYSEQYFLFMRQLAANDTNSPEALKIKVQTATRFILNTYLHTKETLR